MVTDITMPVFSALKLKSKQGLSLSTPDKGQLHWLSSHNDEFRVFALVLNVDGMICDVIPGSMDALQAGPDDIVLPRNIMGNFVMLSPENIVTIPIESLGIGFARLDSSVFNDIVEYSACLAEGKECEIAFSKGFPYLDEEDDRIEYHQKMIDGFCAAQAEESSGGSIWHRIEYPKEYLLVAGESNDEIQQSFDVKVDGIKSGRLTVLVNLSDGTVNATIGCVGGSITTAFDGCRLVSEDGVDFGAFEKGKLVFVAKHSFSFALIDDKGSNNGTNREITLVPR